MRRIRITSLSVGVALVALASLVFVTPGSAAAAAPYCGITWGSLPESNSRLSPAKIFNLRAGKHTCFDRLVVDLRGTYTPGYTVSYGPNVFVDSHGDPVTLRGGAILHVTVNAPAHDDNYKPTYNPPNPAEAVNVAGFRTFRQIAAGGSYEGYTPFAVGVRARLPFRVFVLPGPGSGTRVVVDVAHRWT